MQRLVVVPVGEVDPDQHAGGALVQGLAVPCLLGDGQRLVHIAARAEPARVHVQGAQEPALQHRAGAAGPTRRPSRPAASA